MSRSNTKIGPAGLSVLLHAMIFISMIVAVDYSRPTPITPLMIQATVVQEIPDRVPPPPRVAPEPEPEPVIEQPDNSEDLRRQAEEEKRRQDALLEQKRLDELKRKEEEDRKRREREDEERKERARAEAERQRQLDIQRQREENERLRREEEAMARAQEIEDEERRLAAADSPEMAAYMFAMAQKIRRSWAMPASANEDTVCVVDVQQTGTGDVISVRILSCNGDNAVRRSVEAAVMRASPLPRPSNPDLFRRELRITLRPDQ